MSHWECFDQTITGTNQQAELMLFRVLVYLHTHRRTSEGVSRLQVQIWIGFESTVVGSGPDTALAY